MTMHWDDLNFFRSIAFERSFRRAAARHALSVNTIRARVGRLEESLGLVLFERRRDGLKLSEDGATVLNIALEMDAISQRLIQRDRSRLDRCEREITICCAEGIGESWLVPRLESVRAAIPGGLTFQSDFDQARIHSLESDVCIGFARPTNPDAIVVKLATLHYVLCASEDYLRRHPRPMSTNDIESHRFIVQNKFGLNEVDLATICGQETASHLVFARMNSNHGVHQAVAAGLGIGALPNYVCAMSDNLRPIALPIDLKLDLWLSFSRTGDIPQPIRVAIDWVKDCFRVSDYPWFGESFIHPDAFEPQWFGHAIPTREAA